MAEAGNQIKQTYPLQENFKESDVFCFPITIEQFWQAFLEDDAPYMQTEFWAQFITGSKDFIQNKWSQTISKFDMSRPGDNFSECLKNETAFCVRLLGATIPVTDVPMVKEAGPRKVQAVFKKSDKTIRFKVTTRTAGVPYNNCSQVEECWDVMQVEQSVYARISFRVHMFSRPHFVAGKIESNLEAKSKQGFTNWNNWVLSKIKEIQ